MKKNFRDSFYRKIYNVAQKNDYYLVNNFSFRVDNKTVVKIDHILFGEKYIYVILDRYYNHGLTGQINDSSLISLEEYGKKAYVDNPILENHYLVRRLSAVTSIAENMFIGIVLVNNECDVSLKNKSSVYFLCQKKRFASLIKEIESREIGKMNAEELDAAVQGIAKLNRRKL